MTNEQFEHRIEFILDQQANFAVDIQQLQESQRRLTEAQERTDGMLRSLVEVNLALTGHVEGLAAQIQGLAAHLQKVDDRLDRLAESQAHTDQRLDTLVDVVDKLIRRDGGGSPAA
jgi:chromosome segregation ATPase